MGPGGTWGRGDVGTGSHLEVGQGEEELGQPGQLEEEDVAGAEELGGVAGGETCAGTERDTRVRATMRTHQGGAGAWGHHRERWYLTV